MNLSLFLLIGTVMIAVAPPPQRVQSDKEALRYQQVFLTSGHVWRSGWRRHAIRMGLTLARLSHQLYEFTYSRYLEEVVSILESDPKFSERLRGMPEADVKAGNIADHIDDLDNHIFDKLTKAKLDEIERLRKLIQEQIKADGGAHNVKMPEHLDVTNWERFGKEDLRKLIRRTVQDMDAIDRERKKDFKEYEMRKKAEEDHKLAQMSEEERRKAEYEAEEAKRRHNDHEKLKHPGSRDQLEEVWEESDHMEKDAFDPRTFFALHDLNGDGFWNEDELEALFQVELGKVYNDSNPDDDPRERMEEMYRMREHVTKQMDKNGDRLISLDEFLNVRVYTEDELREFEKEYAKKQGKSFPRPTFY
ncbi:unnamed protein product [Angiostrongylus costaricensis]|uniref:EF-hand domain-containing protein n=1 Tax=Angiostrongylus costaricensis TaxID=334426 RepID=A0A158PKC9_ANGCS|nr:unnamed protein product [Angiostrongylus costaricensis]